MIHLELRLFLVARFKTSIMSGSEPPEKSKFQVYLPTIGSQPRAIA